MRISEVTIDEVKKYARVDGTDDDWLMTAILDAAKSYITNQTGLPLLTETDETTGITTDSADDYEDLTVALFVLTTDMYDQRSMTVDSRNVNKVVESIIGSHCRTLL